MKKYAILLLAATCNTTTVAMNSLSQPSEYKKLTCLTITQLGKKNEIVKETNIYFNTKCLKNPNHHMLIIETIQPAFAIKPTSLQKKKIKKIWKLLEWIVWRDTRERLHKGDPLYFNKKITLKAAWTLKTALTPSNKKKTN